MKLKQHGDKLTPKKTHKNCNKIKENESYRCAVLCVCMATELGNKVCFFFSSRNIRWRKLKTATNKRNGKNQKKKRKRQKLYLIDVDGLDDKE